MQIRARLAQLVERHIDVVDVIGSSPIPRTFSLMITLYPTDTLYALGVDATDPEAVSRLKELKGRDENNPISIAVDSLDMAEAYAEITPLARRLAEKFLPGKLTLVLNAICPMSRHRTLVEGVVGKDGSVGIRIPAHELAQELIHELGVPLTATSANVSGMPTKNTPQEILAQFDDRASWITRVIDAGELPPSGPSTVVDARGVEPVVLREGEISLKAILSVL